MEQLWRSVKKKHKAPEQIQQQQQQQQQQQKTKESNDNQSTKASSMDSSSSSSSTSTTKDIKLTKEAKAKEAKAAKKILKLSRKLLVAGCSEKTTKKEISDLFSSAEGQVVVGIRLIVSEKKFTGQAFVLMSTPEGATKAITLLHGYEQKDDQGASRKLRVTPASLLRTKKDGISYIQLVRGASQKGDVELNTGKALAYFHTKPKKRKPTRVRGVSKEGDAMLDAGTAVERKKSKPRRVRNVTKEGDAMLDAGTANEQKARRVRNVTKEGDAELDAGTADEVKSQAGRINKNNLAVQAALKEASAAYEARQDKDNRSVKQLNDKAKQITQRTLKIIKEEWKPYEKLYHAASSVFRSLVRDRCPITNEPLYYSGFEGWEWILRLSCRIKWKATGDTLTGDNLNELISKGWARLIIFNDPKVNSDTSAYVLHEVEKGVQREILSSERVDDVMNTIAGAGKSRQGEEMLK